MKTTREAAREQSHNERTKALQALLEKNYDAERGYKKGIENAQSARLKHFLKDQALLRNHFAIEIDRSLRDLNEKPKEKGSATGNLLLNWINLKTVFSKNNDEAILEESLRGEKASIKEYEETLKKIIFTPSVTEMLQEQINKIKDTVIKIRSLEDLEE